MPLAIRAVAQPCPDEWQNAPRCETRRGQLSHADGDFVGGVVTLAFLVCAGFVLGLFGLLLRG